MRARGVVVSLTWIALAGCGGRTVDGAGEASSGGAGAQAAAMPTSGAVAGHGGAPAGMAGTTGAGGSGHAGAANGGATHAGAAGSTAGNGASGGGIVGTCTSDAACAPKLHCQMTPNCGLQCVCFGDADCPSGQVCAASTDCGAQCIVGKGGNGGGGHGGTNGTGGMPCEGDGVCCSTTGALIQYVTCPEGGGPPPPAECQGSTYELCYSSPTSCAPAGTCGSGTGGGGSGGGGLAGAPNGGGGTGGGGLAGAPNGGAGTGGSPSCCSLCAPGDECVNDACVPPPSQDGSCWTANDCLPPPGTIATCDGAFVCPCNAACTMPSTPGTCGAVPAPCPATMPTGACSVDGQSCEYGDDVRIPCRTVVTCTNGTWTPAPTMSCAPLDGTGCPADESANGTSCATAGATCKLPDDGVCVCAACNDASCSSPDAWACAPPPPSPCPAIAPSFGQACAVDPAVVCHYGTCGDSDGATRACSSSGWAEIGCLP